MDSYIWHWLDPNLQCTTISRFHNMKPNLHSVTITVWDCYRGVGPDTTLAWPGWKQPDIPVEVDTDRLETSCTEAWVLQKLSLAGIAKLSRLKYSWLRFVWPQPTIVDSELTIGWCTKLIPQSSMRHLVFARSAELSGVSCLNLRLKLPHLTQWRSCRVIQYRTLHLGILRGAVGRVEIVYDIVWMGCLRRTPWTELRTGYTHKTSGFKTSGFKTSGFKTSETSGLQNVRFTKCQVYKTSGLQNVRLQNVWFQNVLSSKYFKTSAFSKKAIDLTYGMGFHKVCY